MRTSYHIHELEIDNETHYVEYEVDRLGRDWDNGAQPRAEYIVHNCDDYRVEEAFFRAVENGEV